LIEECLLFGFFFLLRGLCLLGAELLERIARVVARDECEDHRCRHEDAGGTCGELAQECRRARAAEYGARVAAAEGAAHAATLTRLQEHREHQEQAHDDVQDQQQGRHASLASNPAAQAAQAS
jgi:hypothetical protein